MNKLKHGNLWVLYGKSNTGKTYISATFPKPLLYVQIGDDGLGTISKMPGQIKVVPIESVDELASLFTELEKDTVYKTVVFDTFSLLVSEWTSEKVLQKNKRMTQQLWGDLKIDQEEAIKKAQRLAHGRIVVLTCHESRDSIEGMEDEIAPEVRPSVSKGARTYLEGMANYGLHTTKIIKEINKNGTAKEVVKYAADIGPNPYYWTKLQIDPSIKVPARIINPTYDKIMAIVNAETTQEE